MRLRVLTGPNQSARMEFEGDSCSIGSDESCCDLVLHDDTLLPLHAVLKQIGPQAFELELKEEAEAEIDEGTVKGGTHRVDPNRLFRLGKSELIVQSTYVEPEPVVQEEAVPKWSIFNSRLVTSLSRAQLFAAGVGAVAAAAVGVPFALQALDIEAGGNVRVDPPRVQSVLAKLDIPGLEVVNGNDGLTVRGLAASQKEVEQVRVALADARMRHVRVDIHTAPPIVQYDAQLQKSPTPMRSLGTGVGVMDGEQFIRRKKPEPKAPPGPLRLARIVDNGAEGPFIETTDRRRFALGSVTEEGYTVSSITDSFVVLTRSDERFILTMQDAE